MPDPQTSDTILLVRPAGFAFHAEAARSNLFASRGGDGDLASRALAEFDGLRERLEAAGVRCLILDDTPDPARPDAVFPNNWVSFHADGTLVLYPMATAARRAERRPEALAELLKGAGLQIRRTVDLSALELQGLFLEGTGSLVLDRPARKAFAALGPRTSAQAVAAFDAAMGFATLTFEASDRSGRPIYHTNVLLSLGRRYAILCVEAVAANDRAPLIAAIEASERTIIAIDFAQMEQFAANAIELKRRDGGALIALSSAAKASLRPDQQSLLETLGGDLVDVAIPTIEQVGGGSVRCMIADVHLPAISPGS